MASICKCPQCGKALRIPEAKAGTAVRCPGCKSKFRAPAADSPTAGKRKRKSVSPPPDDDDFFEDADNPYAPSRQSSRKRKKTTTGNFDWRSSLRRMLVIHAIIVGLTVPFIIGGFFSDVMGLVAAAIGCVVMICCILAGRTWTAIDLGRSHAPLGVVAFFVPVVGIALAFRQKGPELRGALLYVTSLIQVVPVGLTMLLFAPGESGRPIAGPRSRTASPAMNPDNWAEIVEKKSRDVTADSPVVTVNARIATARANAVSDLAARGESLLSSLPHYQQGTFRCDVEQRTITFQFRGDADTARPYCHFLGTSTGGIITPSSVE